MQMSRGRLQDGETKARVTAGIGINPINTQYHTSNPRSLPRAQGRQVQHMRITKVQGKVQRMIMTLQFRQIYRCQGDLCPPSRRGLRALRRFKKQSNNKALGRSMKRQRHQRSRRLHLIQITVRKPFESTFSILVLFADKFLCKDIRFAVRAEVQHRTEPIEAAFSWLRGYLDSLAKSWSSLSSSLMFLALAYMIIRIITRTPTSPPVPDLVKVAGLARNFEPLLLYSENGARQIGDLQETSVAVWDLGESVRSANMTSGPLIVEELDQLSESLKTLSIELARFFADVDGDIDGILIVMEWAKRELSVLPTLPLSSLSSAFTNIHTLLCRVGVLESRSTGLPTTLGAIFTDLFGATDSQRTRQTLHRTFNEFLAVLEESINSELTRSTALFTLFESIDRQFLNLQRSVIRESDTQERLEGEFLSSLWVRIMGANASLLRKYEKNKQLLSNVRAKTTSNKSLLVEHNGKLVMLKGNLERLRRQLVSPLVRRDDGSTVGVEEQIKGLEGTYIHLRRTRERQKERMLEGIYGASSGRGRVVIGRDDGPSGVEIEGR